MITLSKIKKTRFSSENTIYLFNKDTFIIRYSESILFRYLKSFFSNEDIIIKVKFPFKIESQPLFYYESSNGSIGNMNVFSIDDMFELEYINIDIKDDYLFIIIKVNDNEYVIKIDYQELFEYYETNYIFIEDLSGIDVHVSIL